MSASAISVLTAKKKYTGLLNGNANIADKQGINFLINVMNVEHGTTHLID